MRLTRVRAFQGAAFALALALSQVAHAQNLVFTVDPTGGATGLTPIANTPANIGQYAAGSWITVGGNLSVPVPNIGTAVGTFSPQVGDTPTGSFSTGNPGSLVSYFSGSLNANVTPTTIAFPGSSNLVPGLYTGTYPEVGGAPVPLIPANGGGTSGNPGSDVAQYGIFTTLKVGGFLSVATIDSAIRSAVLDIQQNTGVLNQALSGVVGTQTFITNNNITSGITSGTNDGYITPSPSVGGSPSPFTTAIPAEYMPSVGTLGTLTTVMINPARQIEQLMLTVPISTTLSYPVSGGIEQLTLNGQIAAYATNQVPEPGSIVLLVMGGLALIPVGYRRLRRQSVDQA